MEIQKAVFVLMQIVHALVVLFLLEYVWCGLWEFGL